MRLFSRHKTDVVQVNNHDWKRDLLPKPEEPSGNVKIEEVKGDVPKFERIYKAQLNDQVRIKITISSHSGLGRWKRGELTQRDGRWILFDPEKVADKILDPVLLPLVDGATKEIIGLDKAFMDTNPDTFTDEKGHVWKKQ